ncbi:MAG: asparagine synthase-related protein [Chloroflexota bacterium]
MARASSYRGPDGVHYWIDKNVGFAHLAFHTTPESGLELQPFVSAQSNLILVADIRLDNYDELIRILTIKGYLQSAEKPSDARLIAAAYECWGKEFPIHLLGDYAIAIWNEKHETLFCARDPLGIRPFFYARSGNKFYFSSTLASIKTNLPVVPNLNMPFIIDFLSWNLDRWLSETVYESIFRLPPSSTLIVKINQLGISEYQAIKPELVTYKTKAEYAERFQELFNEAILSRTRGATKVGITVSGGLDSSSIACMAHYMASNYPSTLSSDIHLFSCIFDTFPNANEREYLETVIQRCNRFSVTTIQGDSLWGLKEFGSDNGFPLDEPEITISRSLLTALFTEARSQDCRVLLSGEGGDQILAVSAYWYPELLFDVIHPRHISEIKYFWNRQRMGVLTQLIYQSLILPLKPFMPLVLREWRRTKSSPAWIKREWIRHSLQNETVRQPQPDHLSGRLAKRIYAGIRSGRYSAQLHYLNLLAGYSGVEYRFPYLDLRLINFILSTPSTLHFHKGSTKLLLREAMHDILPEQVRLRQNYAYFDEIGNYGIRQMEKERVSNLLLDVHNKLSYYIDLEEFVSSWGAFIGSNTYPSKSLKAFLLLAEWMKDNMGY